jgi:hypothetical protein
MANEALARDTVTRGDAVTFEGAFVADPVSLLGPCFPLGGAPEPPNLPGVIALAALEVTALLRMTA